MHFFRQTWNWFWPAQTSFVELAQLQTRLVRSLIYFVALVAVVLGARNYFMPTIAHGPDFLLNSVVLLAIWAHARRPALSRWILRGMLFSFVVIVYWAAQNWASAVAPGVHYLILLGLFATLIDAPAAGNFITLASLGVMLALRQQFGLPDQQAQMLWFNVCSCTVLAQFFGIAFYHVFAGVQAQLNDQAQRLLQAEGERRSLVQALFKGLRTPVQALVAATAQPLATALVPIKAQVLAVADELQAAGSLRQDLGSVDAALAADAGLRTVRRRFMVITLWLALVAVTAATVNNILHGGPLLLPLGIGVGLTAILAWLRGRSVDVDSINRAQMLLYLALFIHGVWQDGVQGVPATLPYLPNMVLSAALLSGFGFALLIAGIGAALILTVRLLGTHELVDRIALINMLMAVGLMTAICREVWLLHATLLRALHARANALAEALRQRRRLLGTLFHDINNPLMAIQGILQLPQVGVPLEPRDQQRVQNMASRIQQLVESAEGFLLVENNVPSASLKPVDVAELFAATQELFEARLKVKRQHLSFSSPQHLAVLALPEVLRDSILSNLVSNALKFSPATAGLSLEAREQGDEVALVVRDTGPGVPEAVIARLLAGMSISSSPGTGGEQGQGLGLGLVQEHLRRLGGRLELERLVGGGTEARAWLKKA